MSEANQLQPCVSRLIRSISMATDHDRYARPIERTRVELYVSPAVTEDEIVLLKLLQEERLLSHRKMMPHSYWFDLANHILERDHL